jgi:5'-3' exonuclease
MDETGVIEKFGVPPASIPDWLALVGDSADGFPGLKGWGAKSASAVLARYGSLESIPADPSGWQLEGIGLGRATKLAETLAAQQSEAMLFRQLARVRRDVPLRETLADLEWRGAHPHLREFCQSLGDSQIPTRVPRWRE